MSLPRRVLFLSLTFLLTACGQDEPAGVQLFSAASTIDAVEDAAEAWSAESGVAVQVNAASTATLAQQVVAGAPADVFLSANEQWADFLEEQGLVAGRVDLLQNALVVVLPLDSELDWTSPEQLREDKVAVVALAEPESVPAGIYAKEALTALGLWGAVAPKLALAGDVRQALLYVERGEADAGIVYATDAAASKLVRVAVKLDPALLREAIHYPLLLLQSAHDDAEARAFFDYLQQPQALRIFERYGFGVLPENAGAAS